MSIRASRAISARRASFFRRSIGFSASLQFEDPRAVVDSRLEGAGVLIGGESTVGRPESFSGHLLLRNVSAEAVTVKSQVQRNTTPNPMPDVRLEPGEAKEVPMPPDSAFSADKEPGAAGLALQYSGKPGDVLAYWFSVGVSGSMVVETPLRNPASLPQAGSNPWSLEGDYSSVLYVKNTSAKPSSFVADIFYPGGYYMIGMKTLQAGETAAIDIRKLRDEQVADFTGRKLPLRLTAGQINWRTRNGEPRLIGRVNTMSVSKGLAANMSCATCCGCTGVNFSLQPGSWTGVVSTTFSFSPVETDSDSCSTQSYPVSPFSFTWSSTSPNVASVDQSAVVSCNAGGTTTVSGDGFFTTQVIDTSIEPSANGCFACKNSSTEQTPGASVNVCDFSITPASATAKDCTHGTENTITFVATPFPNTSSCFMNQPSSTCGPVTATGAIELAVEGTDCQKPPGTNTVSNTVGYFAGPGSGQNVGTIIPEFTLILATQPVTKSIKAPIACP